MKKSKETVTTLMPTKRKCLNLNLHTLMFEKMLQGYNNSFQKKYKIFIYLDALFSLLPSAFWASGASGLISGAAAAAFSSL